MSRDHEVPLDRAPERRGGVVLEVEVAAAVLVVLDRDLEGRGGE